MDRFTRINITSHDGSGVVNAECEGPNSAREINRRVHPPAQQKTMRPQGHEIVRKILARRGITIAAGNAALRIKPSKVAVSSRRSLGRPGKVGNRGETPAA